MLEAHFINVALHIAAGALALAVGLVPLFSRKGGRLHRRAGRLTVGLGTVVIASALLAVVFFDPPAPSIGATLTAGYQLVSGLRALRLDDRGPRPFDVAVAVLGAGLAALIAVRMGSGDALGRRPSVIRPLATF